MSWVEISWDDVSQGDVVGENRLPVIQVGGNDVYILEVEDGANLYISRRPAVLLGVKAYRRKLPLPVGMGAVIEMRSGERLVRGYSEPRCYSWISQSSGEPVMDSTLELLDFTVLSEGVLEE